MPNGKHGDHPLTDIVVHGSVVYGREADDLIRNIAKLCSPRELDEWWQREIGWSGDGALALQKARAQYAQLEERARTAGWEAARPRAQATKLEENERVIVTEWRLAPGAETGWHRHGHDYVVVCLTAGTLLAETANGNVETQLRFGQAYARPVGVEHNIVNSGAAEFVFVEIEIR